MTMGGMNDYQLNGGSQPREGRREGRKSTEGRKEVNQGKEGSQPREGSPL